MGSETHTRDNRRGKVAGREADSAPLFSLMDEAVAGFPDRPCLDFLGKSYSYREVGALVDRAAKGFQRLGVKRGVKVGLFLPNTPYFVICYFAILKAGGTVVNFNPLYVEREIIQQIEDSQTEILVVPDLHLLYSKAAKALEDSRLAKIVFCRMQDILPPLKGFLFSLFKRSAIAKIPSDLRHISFDALIRNDGNFKSVAIEPDKDVAVLQYTGGTTGLPKGAMLTHRNLMANTRQVGKVVEGIHDGPEKILALLPFFHVFAMTVVMNHGIASGSEIVLLPRFDIKQVLKTIAAKRPTAFPGVPTVYTAINHHAKTSKYDLSSLKVCISGGAPLPVQIKKDFETLTGCNLVEGYGLTEASPVVTCNPIDGLIKAGSIGLPLVDTAVEIRSLESPEKEVPVGESGEICVRGPQVMLGYWRRPEETADVFRGGVLHTGDVGYFDEDGYIFLIDRLKDVILCSGYNVYPRVIEEAIHLHPAIDEVTVVGVPDDYRGQNPKAFVKLREGARLTEQELLDFLADKLSPIEMPKFVEFRDELPKTMVGKLSKKELAADEMAKYAAKAENRETGRKTDRETS